MTKVLIVGGGPAGLAAAETLLSRGIAVIVAEAKPTLGRKFLMAGKSGLNLTKIEDEDRFLAAFGADTPLVPMLAAYGPNEIRNWAEALGQETFIGSTGRLFPKAMKASPLLRAWTQRFSAQGAQFLTRHRWLGWESSARAQRFDTSDGNVTIEADATVLAMGGASWARLGSDGAWADILAAKGVALSPFQPANVGLQVAWSSHMEPHFGSPLKGVRLCAGGLVSRGEVTLSHKGLEGGGLYLLSPALRDGATLEVDLFPDLSQDALVQRLSRTRGKQSLGNFLRKSLRLKPAVQALIMECARPLPNDTAALAARLKALPIPHAGPRPMDEAISTAGGVSFEALDAGLMLRGHEGVFCAGEMLDWEAPTGGYLLTACLSTGVWAGQAAADYLQRSTMRSPAP